MPKLFNRQLLIIVLSSGLSWFIHADAEHTAEKHYTPHKLAGNVFLLKGGKGGNVVLFAGKEGVVLVDDDYKEMTFALQTVLQQFGGEKSLAYIINTHWHGDHTGGNIALAKHAPIVAHDNVYTRLSAKNEIKLFDLKSDPYPDYARPSISYSNTLTLRINGEQINLTHYPSSHTDGDTVVAFKNANVIHLGDLYFNGFFPFVDTDHGGNVINLANSIEALLSVISPDTIIIPGHGPVADKQALSDYLVMLRGTVAEVQAMKSEGLNLEAMQERGLSDRWSSWTKGFLTSEVWISLIAASL